MPRSSNRMPWRVLAHGRRDHARVAIDDSGALAGAEFDEIVCGDWLHVEQMDRNHYWARLGDADIWVTIDPKTGRAKRITLDVRQHDGPRVEVRSAFGNGLS